MSALRPPAREAVALVLRRRLPGLARDDRLHRRPRRRRADHRGADLRDVLRHRRHRPDVRHHARAGQCRPVDPGDDDARRRGRDEDHGHAGLDDRSSGCSPRSAAALGVGIFNYALILRAAHPADHRDAVVELHHPVDRHRLRPRPAHQAAAAARRLHHRADRRRPGARDLRRRCSRRCMGVVLAPHDLRPLGHRHRPEPARRVARRHPVERIRFLTYVLCARCSRPLRLSASPAFPAARR